MDEPAPTRVPPLAGLLAALRFLTILPLPGPAELPLAAYGKAVGWYPLAGAVIGGLLVGANRLLALLFPPALAAALTLAAWVILTAALHLDGFLDACDGLLGGHTPELRLEIMRDERVGAYALAGGVLLLLAKFSALLAAHTWQALLLAPLLARGMLAIGVVLYPYARQEGLGKLVKDEAGVRQLILALGITLAASLPTWHLQAGAAVLAALLVTVGVAAFTLRRIPGLTGDVYGAIVELVELAVLLVFAAAGG